MRRETGKEYVVKVHCDEGVAIHVAPDLCAGVREGVGEASVGERPRHSPTASAILALPSLGFPKKVLNVVENHRA